MSWVLTNYYVLLKTKGEVRLEGNVDQVVKDQHKGMYVQLVLLIYKSYRLWENAILIWIQWVRGADSQGRGLQM